MDVKKSIISLSGGLDSTMLLMKLLSQGKTVRAYSFDYGQKHMIELDKVKKNIELLRAYGFPVTHQVINVQDCFNESVSSLNKCNKLEIPKGEYDERNMKSTVVENRNIIFSAIIYGKALSWSKSYDNEPVEIALGIHKGDHSLYPDTTKESRDAAEHCFKVSNWGSEHVNYYTPYVDIEKHEVLQDGIDSMKILWENHISLRTNFADFVQNILINTHSCYDPDELGRSCGYCGTCKERLDAFERCGLIDPIEYESY